MKLLTAKLTCSKFVTLGEPLSDDMLVENTQKIYSEHGIEIKLDELLLMTL